MIGGPPLRGLYFSHSASRHRRGQNRRHPMNPAYARADSRRHGPRIGGLLGDPRARRRRRSGGGVLQVCRRLAASRNGVGRSRPARQLADRAICSRRACSAIRNSATAARLDDQEWQSSRGRPSSAATSATKTRSRPTRWAWATGPETTTRTEAARLTLVDLVPDGRAVTKARPRAAKTWHRRFAATMRRPSSTRSTTFDAWDRCITRGLPRVDAAVQLQQRHSHSPGAGLRRHRSRDDPRGARRAARRPARSRSRDQAVAWASRAATARARRSSSRRRTSPARRRC